MPSPSTNSSSSVSFALIIAVALVLSSAVWGAFYYSAQSSFGRDSLSVTGSAKMSVTSDQAKIILSIQRTASMSQLASGNALVAHDLAILQALLSSKGVVNGDISVSPLFMNQIYDNNPTADLRYNLSQTVTVQSSDVAKITDISKAIPGLASQNAVVSVQSLEYSYSKLADVRVSLLSDAVKDALARANSIAKSTGRSVGGIRSASSGVVQVLPPNSVDVSDYGSYDTSSVNKDIMVTVKASFGLK